MYYVANVCAHIERKRIAQILFPKKLLCGGVCGVVGLEARKAERRYGQRVVSALS